MMQPSFPQFLGISSVSEDSADAILLPLPFEETVTYGQGTRGGPAAILAASLKLELFEEETLVDFETQPQLCTLPPVESTPGTPPPDYFAAIENVLRSRRGKFIVGLGGEHLVTYGTVLGLTDRLSELTIVHLDAHADLIDELEGKYWSHGTVLRRLWEKGCRLLQIGIRSLSASEHRLVQSGPRITTFFAHQLARRWEELIEQLRNLEGPVFLTLDVDALDPSIIPSTGTPQPNGLTWPQTMEILRALACSPKVEWLGADVVEFVPSPHPPGCDLTAARLVQKILAFRHCGQKQGAAAGS
ncbi:MAG: agmatinase family protein [Pirellulales bacterium]|nr:agmatinase family protein [Pirellulales bacterium]